MKSPATHPSAHTASLLFLTGFLVAGTYLLFSLLHLGFQRKHQQDDLQQQARVIAESLHESGLDILHGDHPGAGTLAREEIQDLLSLYETFLDERYPGSQLMLIHECFEKPLEIIQTPKHPPLSAEQRQRWTHSVDKVEYGVFRTGTSLSVLHPLHMSGRDCTRLAACIHVPEISLSSSYFQNPFVRSAWFALGYFGILLLMLLVRSALRKYGTFSDWHAAGCLAVTVFLCGFLFSFQLADFVRQTEWNSREQSFENFSSSATSRLGEHLTRIQNQSLAQLAAFFDASSLVTEAEFQRFTGDIDSRNLVREWFWIPVPPAGEHPEIRYRTGTSPDTEDPENPAPPLNLEEMPQILETLESAAAANGTRARLIQPREPHTRPRLFLSRPLKSEDEPRGWVACMLPLDAILTESLHYGTLRPDTPAQFGLWVWLSGGLTSLILSILVYQNLLRRQLLEKKVRDRTRSLNDLLRKHLNITHNLPLGLGLYHQGEICEMNPRLRSWFDDAEDLCRQLEPLFKKITDSTGKYTDMRPLQTLAGKRQMKCTLVNFVSDSGAPQSLILLEDWTEPLRAEQALRDKTLELERLFNSSTDLLCISTLDGTLLNLNPQWEQTMGHPVSEMTGQNWIDFVSEEDRDEAAKMLRRVCDGSQTRNTALRFVHKRGHEIWLEWKAVREGGLIHANVRDITDRMEAEEKTRSMREQVSRAQRMESIGRLAGGIAHDFNNSLQVIIGNAQLVLNQSDISKGQQALLRDILKAADRSAQLTRQLLGFAMKQHVQPDPTDLNQKLREMEPMFKTILGDQIKLEWDLDSELGGVVIDSGQLEQICVSLLENSREAMPRGGGVRIATANRDFSEAVPEDLVIDLTPGPYVGLVVTDSGNGIDSKVWPTLFEPFTTSQDPSRGSGLGLATVYGILQQNKGSVRVKSETGNGTRMEILLPRMKEKREKPALPRGDADFSGKILVVDDNPQVLQLSSLVLKELQYRVIPCNSAAEALKHLEQDPEVELLLTDVLMPEMTGPELYEKALILRPELKCIFMSGYSTDVVDEDCLQPGKCTFLNKPFSVDGMQEAVAELLRTTG